MKYFLVLILQFEVFRTISSFLSVGYSRSSTVTRLYASSGANSSNPRHYDKHEISDAVNKLKAVLEREYITFFNPMKTEYYAPTVTFVDPMTSLSGVQSYKNNVDMLASRTTLGKLLFSDASIVLHKITGGEIVSSPAATDSNKITNIEIQDVFTRWTLKLTAKILPWKPTARFSGISVYKVVLDDTQGTKIQIVRQMDYWDSVNILPNSTGQYQSVASGIAISDFLDQLKPGGFQAQSAAPELPFTLLRRGNGYEVRAYPSFTAVTLPYTRRDEGFGTLGSFTRGINPLSPALMEVNDAGNQKQMMWPLTFAQPGVDEAVPPAEALEKSGKGQFGGTDIVTIPARVVAVGEYSDASMEPVVRRADRELRIALSRDGLRPADGTSNIVRFAQYDAIFSMGKRRGEVWIDLMEGGHPW